MSTPVPGRRSGLSIPIAGITVEMPLSGLLGVGLIAFLVLPSFGSGSDALTLAVVFAVLFYASILLHEIAHALVATALGNEVDRIVLWVLGGYTSYRRNVHSAWGEGAVAAAGPLTSAALGGACLLVATTVSDPTGDVLRALGSTNVILAIYNSLPGLPLDGGAVLKSVIWASTGRERNGTLVAAWAGRIVAVLVVLIPVVIAVRAGGRPTLTSLVFGLFIGAYLFSGANAALRRVRLDDTAQRIVVRDIAVRGVAVPAGTTLGAADALAASAGAARLMITDSSGVVRGLDSPAARAAVPAERRPYVLVDTVSSPLTSDTVVRDDLVGAALIEVLAGTVQDEFVVVDSEDRPYAVLRLADVEAALSRA